MRILPSVRKRLFINITIVILSLLLLFIGQTSITYFTQTEVLKKIEVRRYKISLCTRATVLSEQLLSGQANKDKALSELQDITIQLSPLVQTPEGKNTINNLNDAISNVRRGGEVEQLFEATKQLSEFQYRRLGDDLKSLEKEIQNRGFRGFITSIVITFILGIFVVWGIHRLSREYLLTKVIMQGTTNGIIVGNEKGRIAILNDTFCLLQGGCKRKDMVGRPLAEALYPSA